MTLPSIIWRSLLAWYCLFVDNTSIGLLGYWSSFTVMKISRSYIWDKKSVCLIFKIIFWNKGHMYTTYFLVSFLPHGVYSGWGIVVSLLVRPYIRPYVRTSAKFLISNDIFVFFETITSVVLEDFKKFWKKWFFWPTSPFFWPFYPIFKGLFGARCKSGDLCWHGFVCRFWIYIVVRLDFFLFSKKVFFGPPEYLENKKLIKGLKMEFLVSIS